MRYENNRETCELCGEYNSKITVNVNLLELNKYITGAEKQLTVN